jgi:hypothetical protein
MVEDGRVTRARTGELALPLLREDAVRLYGLEVR